jgi:plastocyanin
MSILGIRIRFGTIAMFALMVVVVGGALLPAMSLLPNGLWGGGEGKVGAALRRPAVREIVLVARGMAFYLEHDPNGPNPTIDVRAGERVRLVLRNQDRGFTHDFAVPTVNAGLNAIDWNESGDVVFDAPMTPGTYEYVCRPHQAMMRGTLRVTQ